MTKLYSKKKSPNVANITAILLAGGQSRRMGKDKGGLAHGEDSFLEQKIALLGSFFRNVIVAGSGPAVQAGNVVAVGDAENGKGPLAGIIAGLTASESDWNFITTIDTPEINPDFLHWITAESEPEYEAIIPVHENRLECLNGLYRARVATYLIEKAREGEYSVTECLNGIHIKKVHPPSIILMNHPNLFININTPEDYEKWKNSRNP